MCLCSHRNGSIRNARGYLCKSVSRTRTYYETFKSCHRTEGLCILDRMDDLVPCDRFKLQNKLCRCTEACVGGVSVFAEYGDNLMLLTYRMQKLQAILVSTVRCTHCKYYHNIHSSPSNSKIYSNIIFTAAVLASRLLIYNPPINSYQNIISPNYIAVNTSSVRPGRENFIQKFTDKIFILL